MIQSAVNALWEVTTIDKILLGPIDNEEIKISIEEVITLPATRSTYWEVELIHTINNLDQTNAHGGDNRPLKVIEVDVTPSLGG